MLEDGLFSSALGARLRRLAADVSESLGGPVVFGYAGGPRTKTRAENALYRAWGAQVNSMTVAPEVVLANELGIATAAVVVGHKYSLAGGSGAGETADATALRCSLDDAARAVSKIVAAFLEVGEPVPFANRLFRFSS